MKSKPPKITHAKRGAILEHCEDFYIEYRNNFLTVERFAEYYELDYTIANCILKIGEWYNHQRPSKYERI